MSKVTIHYCVHKTPQLDPMLSRLISVYPLTLYFCELHFNIVFQNMQTFLNASVLHMKVIFKTQLHKFINVYNDVLKM
jgi:hypothetical protein